MAVNIWLPLYITCALNGATLPPEPAEAPRRGRILARKSPAPDEPVGLGRSYGGIIKAAIAGLVEHPYLNATLDDENEEIILKKYFYRDLFLRDIYLKITRDQIA